MRAGILYGLVVVPVFVALSAFVLAGCGNGELSMWPRHPWPPWPNDYGVIFSKFITDPSNDLVPFMPDSPPYPVSYSPVDVTQVSLGVLGNYFYIRVDYTGTIPTASVDISEDPPVESQTVGEHDTTVLMDVDNDGMTGGAMGEEVFFQVRFNYGRDTLVGAAYDPVPGTDNYQSWFEGEFGEGGPGHDYVIIRYDVAKLGNLFPRGTNVQVISWSEAMSFDSSGNEFYHHFAFDDVGITTWTLPQ